MQICISYQQNKRRELKKVLKNTKYTVFSYNSFICLIKSSVCCGKYNLSLSLYIYMGVFVQYNLTITNYIIKY